MIHTIDQISINGQGGIKGKPFYGGYIYDLSYNISTGNAGSSTLNVSLVNETGVYDFSAKNFDLTSPYQIQIGSINTAMYATSFRKKSSAQGYLLEIGFTDGSFRLDKFFVGLHKKHGWNPNVPASQGAIGSALSTGGFGTTGFLQGPSGSQANGTFHSFGVVPDSFIILGHEVHPCDPYFKGNTDFIKDIQDPCHPCQQDQFQIDQAKVVDCKKMSLYNIFEVKYNFTELVQALRNKGFILVNANDPNPNYYQNHVGSVREVLSAWCNHFGWTFFWDKDQITFRDLRTVGQVNAAINNFCPNIQNYEEETTLDGTFDKIIATNFTRPGHDQNYDCSDAAYLQIPAYTQTSIPIPALAITTRIDYDAAGLAYYDKDLRSLYHYFIKYKMTGVDKFFPGKNIPEMGLTILSQALRVDGQGAPGGLQTGTIEPSTGLDQPAFSKYRKTIEDTIATSGSDFLNPNTDVGNLKSQRTAIQKNKGFSECFQLLDGETQWRVAANLDKYFFFVAHYDSKLDEANLNKEVDFASNFIGKYHVFAPNEDDKLQHDFFQDYNFYEDPTSCGQFLLRNDDRVNYTFLGNTTGDNLLYMNNWAADTPSDKQTFANLPFAKFLTSLQEDAGSGGAQNAPRQVKLVVVEKNGPGFYPANVQATADTSTIFPNSGQNWLIQDSGLRNQAHTYFPKALGTATSIKGGDSLVRILLNTKSLVGVDRNKTYIFLGYGVDEDTFSYERTNGYHPAAKFPVYFNGDPLNLEIDPATNKPLKDIIYRYPNLKCAALGEITAGSCQVATFTTPAGAFKFYFPVEGGYGCVLQKTRKVLKRYNKYESVSVAGTSNTSKTLALNVTPISITDQDITKFLKVSENSCVFNDSAIQALHQNYVVNLGISQTTPLIKRTFTVEGVPSTSLGVTDGLQAISIAADENGIRSTYTFGTTHLLLPDPDVYSSARENNNILNRVINNDTNGAPQLKTTVP